MSSGPAEATASGGSVGRRGRGRWNGRPVGDGGGRRCSPRRNAAPLPDCWAPSALRVDFKLSRRSEADRRRCVTFAAEARTPSTDGRAGIEPVAWEPRRVEREQPRGGGRAYSAGGAGGGWNGGGGGWNGGGGRRGGHPGAPERTTVAPMADCRAASALRVQSQSSWRPEADDRRRRVTFADEAHTLSANGRAGREPVNWEPRERNRSAGRGRGGGGERNSGRRAAPGRGSRTY